MKKIILISFVILSRTLIVAQIPGPDPLSVSEKKSIKENRVSTSCITKYKLIKGNEVKQMGYDSMIYNTEGRLIRRAWLMTANNEMVALETYYYIYDQKGLVKEKKVVYEEPGATKPKTDYERYFYNAEGKVIKSLYYSRNPETSISEDSITYTYEKGKLKRTWEYWAFYIFEYRNDTVFKYDEKNHELMARFVNDLRIFTNGGYSKWSYNYNKKGQLVGVIQLLDGKKNDEIIREYKNGLPITNTSYNNDQPYLIERYSYTHYE